MTNTGTVSRYVEGKLIYDAYDANKKITVLFYGPRTLAHARKQEKWFKAGSDLIVSGGDVKYWGKPIKYKHEENEAVKQFIESRAK